MWNSENSTTGLSQLPVSTRCRNVYIYMCVCLYYFLYIFLSDEHLFFPSTKFFVPLFVSLSLYIYMCVCVTVCVSLCRSFFLSLTFPVRSSRSFCFSLLIFLCSMIKITYSFPLAYSTIQFYCIARIGVRPGEARSF